MKKINLFMRSSSAGRFSIERLFSDVIVGFDSSYQATEYFCPTHGARPTNLLRNLWFAFCNRGELNHISGDVHYLALALPPKKTVLTIHDIVGIVQTKGLKRYFIRKLWYEWPIRRAAVVTVISEKVKEEVLGLFDDANKISQKIVVVPNCVSDEFLETQQPQTAKFNKRPTILQIGTKWNKNLERVAQAVRQLDFKLRILGTLTPAQKEFLESIGCDYSESGRVTDGQVIQEYLSSDIVCFASLYEGFGLPILEAQALGKALICSNIEPLSTVSGIGAETVDPMSTEAIQYSLQRLANSESEREKVIKAGRDNARKYSKSAVAKKYQSVYDKINSAN